MNKTNGCLVAARFEDLDTHLQKLREPHHALPLTVGLDTNAVSHIDSFL